jgi:hypothetical protein
MRCTVTKRVPTMGQNNHPWTADLSAEQVAWIRSQYGDGAVHILEPVEPEVDEPEAVEAPKRKPRR